MDFETLKQIETPVGFFVAPDCWSIGNTLTRDEDGILRLHGRFADYAIHSVEVSGRGFRTDVWEWAPAVRVKITFAGDNGFSAGEVTRGWMAVEPHNA